LYFARLTALLCAVVVLAGCGGDEGTQSSPQAENTPASTSASGSGSPKAKGPLKFKVVGKCYSEPGGGTLLARSTGFTPSSTYTRVAWYPKKPGTAARSEYRFLVREGHTTPRGKAIFEWDCNYTSDGEPDPPGRYKLQVTDDATSRSKVVFFRILPAEQG
jgi:hypothetical protein